MEVQSVSNSTGVGSVSNSTIKKKLLLLLMAIMLSIGNCGGPLIMRLYFLHGGERIWLSAWLQTGGFPIILIPLVAAYLSRRKAQGSDAKVIFIKPIVFLAAAFIGCLTGLDDYLYAYGVAKLPVSTSSLIISSQLAFTAVSAYLLVKQKFSAYSINAVVLLTIGAAVLALHSSSDRPEGESNRDYILGFVLTLLAAALYGFILPLVELAYAKGRQTVTFTLVLEFQTVMSFFATLFCTVGMVINNDFQAISREAREFGVGESEYYVILVWSAIIWQGFFMGAVGVIYCSTSLLCGVIIAVLLPVTEILAVIFYHEKFQAGKGVSLVLSLWGFVSYFYGENKLNKDRDQAQNNGVDHESPQKSPPNTEVV